MPAHVKAKVTKAIPGHSHKKYNHGPQRENKKGIEGGGEELHKIIVIQLFTLAK